MEKLISKQTLDTLHTTPYVLSKDLDYAFETMFKKLKADMRENPGREYTLSVVTTLKEE